jgi:hypothetical protein
MSWTGKFADAGTGILRFLDNMGKTGRACSTYVLEMLVRDWNKSQLARLFATYSCHENGIAVAEYLGCKGVTSWSLKEYLSLREL